MAMPNLIAVGNPVVAGEDDFAKNAVGLMVFWTLSGDLQLEALKVALSAENSAATPPDEPSPIVALHRACDEVARAKKLRVLPLKRGEYVLTGSPEVDTDVATGGKAVRHDIQTTASIVAGAVVIDGEHGDDLRAAYDAALRVLAPTDIGTWLCDKLRAIKAVPLRERGGVYFVPADLREKWGKVARALGKCSAHKIHTVPAMKSDDAIDAVLAALSSDTRTEIDAIDAEIRGAKIGARALRAREAKARELLTRAAHYEGLLGVKLDELRASLAEIQGTIATAVMAAESGE